MTKPGETTRETAGHSAIPAVQGLAALACKMNLQGIQPPIDPEIIAGLGNAIKASGEPRINKLDKEAATTLRADALGVVYEMLGNTVRLDDYVRTVGPESPQALFVRHIAQHHSSEPEADQQRILAAINVDTTGRMEMNPQTRSMERVGQA